MNKTDVIATIHDQWLSMIMRGDTAQETLAAMEAVIEGGSRVVEVAFTTPDVCRVIGELHRRHGDRIVLAAGTVRTADQARQAFNHGARVIVSPNLYAPVVETALKLGAVSIPGCFTPTEVADALRLGADIIKLFPCEVGGPNLIRYLQGPFPEVRLLPAGAVTLENMQAYYQAGAFAAVAGVTTEMQLLQAVKGGRYDEVTRTTQAWLARVAEMKGSR